MRTQARVKFLKFSNTNNNGTSINKYDIYFIIHNIIMILSHSLLYELYKVQNILYLALAHSIFHTIIFFILFKYFINYLSQSVTLHTNHGDIKVEVFCDMIPLASEVLFLTNIYLYITVSIL